MGIRLEDNLGASYQRQSTYIAPNSFTTVGPANSAVFGGPIVRPQTTNLLVMTEDFQTAASVWVMDGVVVTSDAVAGPSGSMADLVVWSSTSGNLHQNATQSLLASGFIYTFSLFMKGLNNGDIAHIGIGGDFLWKNQSVILTTDWQRVEVFGMYEKGPSGNVLRGYIYPPASGGVYVWGAQLEFGPSATDYIAATGMVNVTRPIQVETDCIYVPQQTSNYYKNNIPPLTTSWSAFQSGLANLSGPISPLGVLSSRMTSNSANSNRVLFTENVAASAVVSKISYLVKPETSFGTYTFSGRLAVGNGFLYSNICENRTFQAGSQNCTGFMTNLGDGWNVVEHFSQNEAGGGGQRNEFGMTSYGRSGFSGVTLSPNQELLLFGGIWNSRTLGQTPITSNGSISSAVILEDVLTAPSGCYTSGQGTFILDAYVDWTVGIGTDSAMRTLFDASSTASGSNRILLYKDTAANKYNLEVYGSGGVVSSGTVTLQLAIGWHRFGVTYSSGSCELWIDGTRRILTSGAAIDSVGTVRIGGNKFQVGKGWGAWIKNFYSFRTQLSDAILADYTGLTRTQYNSYRTEQIVSRTYQQWIEPTFGMVDPVGAPIGWAGNQSGSTGTVTSGIIDPFGTNLAYRVVAGNSPATDVKWRYTGRDGAIVNGVTKSTTIGEQNVASLNFYVPNTRSYRLRVWARANITTPQPSINRNSPQGTTSINLTSSWSLLDFGSTTPTTVGSLNVPTIRVPVANQATGTIDVELFNPIMDVDVSIRTEVVTPVSSDIPVSSGMIYKLKFAGNLNHGHVGTYESTYTDMGRNTSGTPYISVDILDSIPEGSSIVYEYFASDSDTSTPVWKTSVEEISGRFFKIKAYMQSEDVESANPEVISVRPRPQYS